jgi:hypothetical protein
MQEPSWKAVVVAFGFIGLVALMFWLAVDNDFETIWAGAGSIVGVLTGAIPAYFFHQQAQQAQRDAQQANERAVRVAAVADPQTVRAVAPELFGSR